MEVTTATAFEPVPRHPPPLQDHQANDGAGPRMCRDVLSLQMAIVLEAGAGADIEALRLCFLDPKMATWTWSANSWPPAAPRRGDRAANASVARTGAILGGSCELSWLCMEGGRDEGGLLE